MFAISAKAQLFNFTTIAGSASQGNIDGASTNAQFYNPGGVAMDPSGNIFVADTANHTIRKITPAGTVSTFAGTPGVAGSTDGANALFNSPQGVASDVAGNIYVADTGNFTIRKITAAGVVSTLAGSPGIAGTNNATGTNALFYEPEGLAVDSFSNIYVADTWNHTIRKITPAAAVSTLAGSAGSFGTNDGTGAGAQFYEPAGVAVDASGNVYVADTGNNTIRKITSGGTSSTLAGLAGSFGSTDATGTNALFNAPAGITVDASGNVYVADSLNNTIRKVTSGDVVTTIAGTAGSFGSADGTNGTIRFWGPQGVAANPTNNNFIYVADTGNSTVRQLTLVGANWTSSTVAASAGIGSTNATGTAARFFWPMNVAVDASSNLYVADAANNTIRKITPVGVVSTFAGSPGIAGSTDAAAGSALFNSPQAVAVDASGNVFVSDTGNGTIREISGGSVSTLAGSAGNFGSLDGTNSMAQFFGPQGIAVDGSDNVFVADSFNHTIRKITPAGVVTTLAGTAGIFGGFDGTNGAAHFNRPTGLCIDGSGNLFVADLLNHTIRKVTPAGVVSTLAGLAGFWGANDGTNTTARFFEPEGIAVSGTNIYVADSGNNSIRQVTVAGTNNVLTTIAGWPGNSGSADGSGIAARFNYPAGMALAGGNLLVVDSGNNTIRSGSIITNNPPTILSQPQSQAVNLGATATFTVSATGSEILYYQWQFNGTNIPGATATNFIQSNVQPANAGNYSMLVTGPTGATLSSNALLAIIAPPVVTNPPVNQTVAVGATVQLTVGASGTQPLIYQWSFNNTNIPSATSATLTLPNVQLTNTGTYSVLITNLYGTTNSSAVLTVTTIPITITNQPVSQTALQGSTVTISVLAGPPPLTYQWQKNGLPLANSGNVSGATNSTLTLSNITTADSANYSVLLGNASGNVTSSPAALTVFFVPPPDSIQPYGWWLLNEGTGTTAYDYSGNAHNGTLNSGATWTASGYPGNGVYFNATSTAKIPVNNTFIWSGNWTATMWVNRWESKDASVLIGGTHDALKLEQHAQTNHVGYTIYGTADYVLPCVTPLNSWVHLAFVKSAAGTFLYTNGVLVASNIHTNSLDVVTLGCDNFTDYLDATMDDVRVYTNALTAQQITNIFAYGRITPTPTVTLATPTNNSSYVVSTNIVLAANVVSNGQSIASIGFYAGTNLIGQATAQPYQYIWTNVPSGNFVLTAQVVFNGTSTTVSPAVGINVAISTNSTGIVFEITNGILRLSWPPDHTGWSLQAQTNTPGAGLGTNWVNVSASNATNALSIPLIPTNSSVFYRLKYP